MAGQAVLSSFMQVLFEKLATAALNEFRLLRGVDKELQNLATTLSTIQALLEDAEEKQFRNKSVGIWLARLKEVAYDMDELLDFYAAESLQLKVKGRAQSHWKKQVSPYLNCLYWHKVSSKHKLAHTMESFQKRLDTLARERHILGLEMLCGTSQLEITERPQTSSLVDDSNVFGREKEKESIVRTLLLTSNTSRLSVLPIVGMGGLGKTTLAQLVYNDPRIKECFPLRMWVCVSENFNETKLTKETLESASSGYASASGYSFATTNMNLLQEDLCGKLEGKRFLLVLDDIWNEDPDKWDRYRNALIAGERGSKIIVTTRNEKVGRTMGGLHPYHLKHLSDDDCWKLFKNYAFVDGDSSLHPNLEEMGKEIVKKLKGLPLAAKTLGSLLYSKLDEEVWKNILKSEIWELPDKNNILPALRLSYKHLPPHLKQCFAFCSVFHKDYVFEKDKLVQIWMALGFIQPQGRKRLEDTGSSYFDELVSRSFFQRHKGNYVMHDAIHDLAQFISIGECHRLEDGVRDQISEKTRHLSFSCANSMSTLFEPFYKFEKLRTLLLLQGYKSKISPIPEDLCLKLRFLRVLDLHRRDINELPNPIGNLIQLRYLGLSGTGIKTLPLSISRLHNLQTLKLKYCNFLTELPKGLTNLINLRHLEVSTRLTSQIAGIGKLTCLQELEEFVVRKDKGHRIKELKDMNELRGHLCIRNLENVVSGEEASKAKLNAKEYLTVLDLVWSDDRHVSSLDEHLDNEVLEGLQPHLEVKELTIKGYAGVTFPSWLGSPSLSYLQTIHLSNCRGCTVLPPLGQLPSLRYLDVGEVYGVVQIGQEFSGFPSLSELVLEDMLKLKEWSYPDDDESFPCLTALEVVDCPKLGKLPCLPPSLTRLRISETGIKNLPEVRPSNSRPLPSLSTLHIHECPNLGSLRQGLFAQQLRDLQELTITNCEKLESLPVHGFRPLVALKKLHIYNCPHLAPQGEEGRLLLPMLLEDLQISSSSKLINPLLSELKSLPSLAHLKIADCTDLYHFPDEGLPVTLKFLGISDCENLQSLPSQLQELISLTVLVISNCPQIPCLPMHDLPSVLQELYIKGCPLLKERCQENGGHDWPKIAHILKIQIDDDIVVSERGGRRKRLSYNASIHY
ncbi:putative disease resistance protein RGA1 [Phoenix dactylifera]|uniref:Disease resistance protein RGA1 n=1 Tax=Phoenix dactylifera TaxID=42345 RepID=A0A8B8J3Z1_PHODC|nr:putative disease resistance protein RGA1 [Phoenix dactylifera]XP_026660143.2 putative disease resistance protein RGA1 [Phoenix dactylifera]XP_026660144.2 putative disease resistance protein RGA1 [Phoenix dactylifera]XP_038980678.1 putative disease resistance protein RGA1 [Phoenix dactylifera]XP_038980679.1 putative disease resistance protein RGA1 [Phoenix dactylifera]XP_038980680.1 putative disease resistance protein RGA1 [Phoenix dactylifera]